MGGGASNVTSTNAPWDGQSGFLLNNYANAQNDLTGAMNGSNLQYYPGQTYAPLNSLQQSLIGNTTALDAGGSPIVQSAMQSLPGLQSGSGLFANDTGASALSSLINGINPQSYQVTPNQTLNQYASGAYVNQGNPYIAQQAGNVAAQVLPQINSNFAAAGREDSGLATSAEAQGLGNAIGNLDYNNYTTEQGLQQNAQQMQIAAQQAQGMLQQGAVGQQLSGAGALANAYGMDTGNAVRANAVTPMVDSALQSDIGNAYQYATQLQNQSQNQNNAAQAAYNYQQSFPWNASALYGQLITGNVGSNASTSYPLNQTANALAAATGGLSVANGLYGLGSNASGMFGSLFGSGASAGAGAALAGTTAGLTAASSPADVGAAIGMGLLLGA